MWLQFFETTRFWKRSLFSGFRKMKNPIGQMRWLYACCKIHPKTGLEIVTDTVANAANIFSLLTKNSGDQISVWFRFKIIEKSKVKTNISSYCALPMLNCINKASLPPNLYRLLSGIFCVASLSYTSTIDINTISYNWRLKKVPLLGEAYPYCPLWGVPPTMFVLIMNSPVMRCQFIMALK